MTHRVVLAVAAVALIAVCTGCGSSSSAPLTPTTTAATVTPSPKISTPAPQSPVNGQLASSLTAGLTASTATADISSYVVQYRFQVFNGAALTLDSGLLDTPAWTTTVALTPNASYTWRVRAESQGFAGAWSDAAAFTTPDAPPAYSGPIGNWQVHGTAQHSWEEAINLVALGVTRHSRPGEQLLALLRTGQHLYQASSVEDLLQQALKDAVIILKARRGCILKANEATGLRVVHACWADEMIDIARQANDVVALYRRHARLIEEVNAADAALDEVQKGLNAQNHNPVKLLTSGPERLAKGRRLGDRLLRAQFQTFTSR